MDRKGKKAEIALDCAHAPGYALRVLEYPRDLRQPVHTHDRASVTLVLRGAIEETRGHLTDYPQPFSVISKAARIPFRYVRGRNTRSLNCSSGAYRPKPSDLFNDEVYTPLFAHPYHDVSQLI